MPILMSNTSHRTTSDAQIYAFQTAILHTRPSPTAMCMPSSPYLGLDTQGCATPLWRRHSPQSSGSDTPHWVCMGTLLSPFILPYCASFPPRVFLPNPEWALTPTSDLFPARMPSSPSSDTTSWVPSQVSFLLFLIRLCTKLPFKADSLVFFSLSLSLSLCLCLSLSFPPPYISLPYLKL